MLARMEGSESADFRYDGVHCEFVIRRPAPGVVVMKITGTDVGELGDAPMQGLDRCLAGPESVYFFIDARDTRGASIGVSGEWAVWLSARKPRFRRISMLVGSRFIEMTADFVRRFAALEGVMRIYTDAAAFEDELSATCHQPRAADMS
jgi:hypothetical protein